jgi:UDP-N-acetylmuramoyl-L-alanyl-D-glutamate--2,6-diaminopimelate ligase
LAVLNADDPACAAFARETPSNLKVCTYAVDAPADVVAANVDESLDGSHFTLDLHGERAEVWTPLVGRHNVSNALAAAAAAAHLGIGIETIAAGIESLCSVPGRLERVDCGQPFDVFVDYAHTDDALRRCIRFLDRLASGRVICVFGAGGDRDRSKRPLLGQAASEAGIAVVTSDNPRSEDPARIIEDILPGFSQSAVVPHVECDRAQAIHWALDLAEPGDCVLVAGKGHETEQIVGALRIPFDDRAVVREILKSQIAPRANRQLKIPA